MVRGLEPFPKEEGLKCSSVAISALNGSDGKWEGPLTWHVPGPAIFTA